jgi:hypothetical protein
MSQDNCPGVNNTCGAAEVVAFPNSSNPFARAVFKRNINVSLFTDGMPAPACGNGGRDAIWKVLKTVGTTGRHFTIDTGGSNFDTMLSIWSGDCTNLVAVTCTNQFLGVGGERLGFTTDGTNTFFIVGEGSAGQYGKLKIQITSP